MSGRILIIEDERDLVSTLEYRLKREGYEVRSALTGAAGLEMAGGEPVPDLVLLDLMLPDMGGTKICKTLRADPRTADVAVVMLTAKGEEIDRVVGFEVGADDYVVKPFSMRELILRIAAVLRRRQGDAVVEREGGITSFGSLRVDAPGHRAWVEGGEIALTALEFRLLTTLLERRGRVQTRDTLLADVWGYEADVTTRTVDTHVKRLRTKLGAAGAYVETVRGVGYRFRTEP